MIENAIKKLFDRGERKVVIPGIGAIVKRDSGELIFSDMLRHDDGRLVTCISELDNIPKEQALALTAAYSDHIGRSLTEKGEAEIHGIGKIMRRADGSYTLVAPTTAATDTTDATAAPTTPEPTPAAPVMENIAAKPNDVPDPIHKDPVPVPAPESASASTPAAAHTTTPAPKTNKAKLRAALYGDDPEDGEDDELHLSAPHQTPSQNDPKPVTTTHTPQTETVITERFTETVATETPSAETSQDQESPQRPTINIRRPGRPKKNIDVVMIAAIVALLIGLGVLLYGFITKQRLAGDENYIELTTEDPTSEQ